MFSLTGFFSTWFERISIMVILLNCVTLGMYQPCENIDCSSDRCQILQAFDAFIYIFFALEMVVKMVALGIFGRRCYLGDTWNRLDFFIVMSGMQNDLGMGRGESARRKSISGLEKPPISRISGEPSPRAPNVLTCGICGPGSLSQSNAFVMYALAKAPNRAVVRYVCRDLNGLRRTQCPNCPDAGQIAFSSGAGWAFESGSARERPAERLAKHFSRTETGLH
ncbi:hypothetical protein SKAU_G00299820 [Synaphobranchus kaupii]|uniref:Ion transport domain-containing protein n=1 Tax=Synaphobranchus kaupii TaxID=118154 RepID=A0A9Q1EVG2_SYNKA|nr:hypothetical protein SKAU_G00299820 [Synaphobranchus kaupii]